MDIFRGLFGIVVLLALAWCFSTDRRGINWRLVGGGLLLQLLLAAGFFLLTDATRYVINPVAQFFADIVSFSDAGARMVFSQFADHDWMSQRFGASYAFVFAFRILPTIIFFSALTSLLYYLGILQRIVYALAWVMKRLMRLSGAESLAAAGEVFLGQTESALLIKPYVPKMTRSEILTLMIGGLATIAGGVMAAYIGFVSGGDRAVAQEVARNLLCASLMNAPAAIVISKILVPEREAVNENLTVPREKMGSNFFDSIASGTTEGLHLALNVGAMLIAFVALVALANYFLHGIGGMIPVGGGASLNDWISDITGGALKNGLSLQSLFAVVFAPVAWLIGIDGGNLLASGQLLGTKLALNEFLAYEQLGQMRGALDMKTVFILQFALCGFANFGSIGIQIGGIATIAPEQRRTLSAFGIRALFGGTIACLLSAAIAGMFFRG
jgi:CNT family concentrative nucleoside transporter